MDVLPTSFAPLRAQNGIGNQHLQGRLQRVLGRLEERQPAELLDHPFPCHRIGDTGNDRNPHGPTFDGVEPVAQPRLIDVDIGLRFERQALRKGDVRCNDGSLVRRDSIGDITFRPERERAMMMTFWLAMASAGKRFGVVEEPTWLYRRHSTNLSNQRSAHDNALRQEALAEYAA